MNEHVHPIFRDILATIAPKTSTFAKKPQMKDMSAKEYYARYEPLDGRDDDYGAAHHHGQLQREQDQQG